MPVILIVEDDKQIADSIELFLKHSNFKTLQLNSGEKVIQTVKEIQPDLVLLDIMLPVKDGVSCCKEIRTFSDVPIIILTAKVEEIDRLIGLEAGADDYVCKPFSPVELVLRIKAILRRINGSSQEKYLTLNENNYCLTYRSASVELTKLEFELFKLLYQNPHRIYSRQKILELVYHDMLDISDRAIDSHVKKIRKKTKLLNINSAVIESVYGAGYRYCEPDQ